MAPIVVPNKIPAIWANDEGSSFLTQPIPTTPQTGGRASFADGFPQICFVDPNAGGKPPDGRDVNGVLYMLSAAAQFQQAGGVYAWDVNYGALGYPVGAVVAHATVVGFFWINGTAGNTTNPDAGGAGWTAFQIANQPATAAQLRFTSSTSLTLAPQNGGWLWINGFNYQVTNQTVSNSGLSANVLYYVYAAVAGGVLVIDTPSTTGYTFSSNGIAIKSGDPTRTLVGMAATNSSGQFSLPLVRSYWWRQNTITKTVLPSPISTGATVFVEISTALRNSFLVWLGESVSFAIGGAVQAASGNAATSGIAFDGTSAETEQSVVGSSVAGNTTGPIGVIGVKTGLAEGLHYATLLGATTAGASTWRGTSGGAAAAVITINVPGM